MNALQGGQGSLRRTRLSWSSGESADVSSSVMHIERDLKLSVPPRFRMPNLAEYGAIQTGPPQQSTTIFYDTADLALAGWGCLLRHRTREGWTVKLPDLGTGDGLERPEIAF